MHKSVLLQETIENLALFKGGVIIDATGGAGGHTSEVLKRIGNKGRVLVIDKDESALEVAKQKLGGAKNVKFAHGDFKDIEKIAVENGFPKVDAVLFDIGVSSMQLDQAERGFSFSKRAKLDMRMDQSFGVTAAEVVNTYPQEELIHIFRVYGEEPNAKKIAREIVKEREKHPIIWTDQLSEVVRRGMSYKTDTGGKGFKTKRIDPATKVFQAIRIEVNGELHALTSALPQAVSLLNAGGRIAVISFHSLEDRIVKDFFKKGEHPCECPSEYPKCICGRQSYLKVLTKKPVIAGDTEIQENRRARSAKLRVAEKINDGGLS
jgi:16S rRNA (cytosine1402-N4)-methyltransferase